jgi:zinc/manganese transport system substrate-binding protein
VKSRIATQPVKMVLYSAYQSDQAANWLAEQAKIPAVKLPFTVGGTEAAQDLFALFDDTLQRLLSGLSQ